MPLRAIGCWLILLIGIPVQSPKAQYPSPTAHQQSAESTSTLDLTPTELRALSVVDHLLEVSSTFPDDYLTVRFRAQIADTLWPYDGVRARKLLVDAFRAIDTVTEPADKGVRPIYLGADTHLPLRGDVLRIAARGDSALAQQLAESIIVDPASSIANRPEQMAGLPNEKEALYLAVAWQILPSDQARAIEMARTALSHANENDEILVGFIKFAQSLQPRDSKAADDLLSYAIAQAERNFDHAFGSIRFLGLYCFPDSGGTVRFRTIPPTPAPGNSVKASPAAINRFLAFAYNTVIQQPDSESPQPNWSAPGGRPRWVGNDYYAVQLLTPYFARYMPEKAAPFSAKLEALIKNLPPAEAKPAALAPPNPNNMAAQVAAAEGSRFQDERDSFYDRAVELALIGDDYPNALRLANKIGDARARSDAVFRVTQALVSFSIRNKDFDVAHTHAKELPGSEQAGLLGNIALAVAPGDKAKAMELLAEALQAVQSPESRSGKAPRMLSIAFVASRVDMDFGFRTLELAVDQINRTGYDLVGENATHPGPAGNTTTSQRLLYGATMLSFDGLFKSLGQGDFDRTLRLAQAINVPDVSAMIQLAACRAILSKPFVPHIAASLVDK